MKSQTTELRNGVPVISEQTASLVNRVSANGLLKNEAGDTRIAVNESHSDMVKYYRGHLACRVILQCIRDISSGAAPSHSPQQNSSPEMQQTHLPRRMTVSDPESAESYLSRLPEQKILKAKEKILQELLEFLDALSLDSRRVDIDLAFENTFEWVFDISRFTQWLHNGTGIFWINGKPGSGKSTLMKYIFENRKTQQLVLNFRDDAKQIFAGFFFHFRGTALQKSFEGLLRSLLKQILQEEPALLDELLPLVIVHGSLEHPGLLTVKPQWTISNLKERLQRILSQKQKMLDLVLFFDALDEFDGHLEAICRFLQDLVKQPEKSMTRIRVCFSSRPWEIFETHFDHCPKITIHEHTRDDIKNYYLGMVSDSEQNLAEMAPEVVERASGVFLWVRLLIRELKAPMTTEQPSEEIKERFLSFPDELDQFYDLTISRIPAKYRWNTFVLLEVMIRAVEDYERALEFLYWTVLISQCRTSIDARKEIERSKVHDNDKTMWKSLFLWSGGLVEEGGYFVGEPWNHIRMMHQSVYDFVSSARFKGLVLGTNAKITHENGYSFLAKYHWIYGDANQNDLTQQVFYARQAESTTGRSNLEFYRPDFDLERKEYQVIGTRGFLFYASLILCLRELIQLDSSFLKDPQQPFLFLLFLGFVASEKPEMVDIVAIVELLRDHGYPIRREIPAFFKFVVLLPKFYPDIDLSITDPRCGLFLDKVGHIIFHDKRVLEEDIISLDGLHTISFRPLHYSSSAITEILLRLGSNPNVLDSRGLSPLDRAFQNSFSQFTSKSVARNTFEKCCILLRADDVALTLSEQEIQQVLGKFDKRGYDTTFLRERVSYILKTRQIERPLGLFGRGVKKLKDMSKAYAIYREYRWKEEIDLSEYYEYSKDVMLI